MGTLKDEQEQGKLDRQNPVECVTLGTSGEPYQILCATALPNVS